MQVSNLVLYAQSTITVISGQSKKNLKLNEPRRLKLQTQNSWQWVKHARLSSQNAPGLRTKNLYHRQELPQV